MWASPVTVALGGIWVVKVMFFFATMLCIMDISARRSARRLMVSGMQVIRLV